MGFRMETLAKNLINTLDIYSTCDKFTRTKYRTKGNFFLGRLVGECKFTECGGNRAWNTLWYFLAFTV